ncbi:sentrin-specific protease-like [Drosophila pseudoobscura]|uniref:Sentrin-specific protease-like n=1 Tax=Drosophila pseudoobscura pseudoobscura TaxID=46245 RepID=A0A6I8VNJ2_DROPS|nr:sentrin-specific protease-like [Drosophila pseudoobscura]
MTTGMPRARKVLNTNRSRFRTPSAEMSRFPRGSPLKRWTSKIDVFSKDIILVPVHCNLNHWCMAIIHLKNKTIFYYDSLGDPSDIALDVLQNYIIAESLDKRKVQYDMSGFRIENVIECQRLVLHLALV